MSRRVLLAVLSLIMVAVATAPWTTSSDRIRESVARQIKTLSGLDLEVHGRTTVAFLPVPRLKFRDIVLTAADGSKLVEGGQLRGEIRLLPLLAARMELNEISLNASQIAVAIDSGGRSSWEPTLAKLRSLVQAGASSEVAVRRVVLTDCTLAVQDARTLGRAELSDTDLVLSWPQATGALAASGNVTWNGDTVSFALSELTPAALLGADKSRFTLSAQGKTGALWASGEVRTEPQLEASGQATIATGSLRDFARWSGLPLPLAGLVPAFALSGEFGANAREISWPSARLTIGQDRLDGSLSILRESGRPLLRATLASNAIDLTELMAPFAAIRAADGSWTDGPFSPGMGSAGNLDLRLSAALAQIGPFKLQDVAASVLQTENRLEVALGRAGLERGNLKGRMTLGIGSGFYDFKAQGAFDRLDLTSLFSPYGQKGWLSGTAQGQFAIDAFGESPADLIRQVSGRGSMSLRGGEVSGVAFDDLLKRLERRPVTTPFEWRGGRTLYDQGQIGIHLANGVAEITEGTLTGPTTKTSLQGRVSLPDRLLALRTLTEAVSSTPAPPNSIAFDISGPWDDLRIAPNVEALVRRSDAARALLLSR